MSRPIGGGIMETPTKQDLKDLADATKRDFKQLSSDIKEHINLLIAPIIKEQEDMATILIGKTKINGVVGEQKEMKTNIAVIKTRMMVVYGLLGFVSVVIVGTAVKLVFFS